MLFKPTEGSGAAEEMTASLGHPHAVIRASGQLSEGVRNFEFALDSTVESVYFFISLQCLESMAVLPPSGEELRIDAPEVSYHVFEAIRLITVKAPAPGTWKVSITGRGFFSIIVKAKSDLALGNVALTQDGKPIEGLTPLGASIRLAVDVSGQTPPTAFHFIAMGGEVLQTFSPASNRNRRRERSTPPRSRYPPRTFAFS